MRLRPLCVQEPILVDRGTDQADGLRRMFGGIRPRVLDIVAGEAGVGRASLVANLGAALAKAGRDTLLVDYVEQPATSRILRYLGMPITSPGGRGALTANSVPGCKGCAALELSQGQWLQAGPVAASGIATITSSSRETLSHDWILVSGATDEPVVVSDDGWREVVVILSKAPSSITQAYALIKRMSARERRCRFHVLVNRVQSYEAASRAFQNMAQVAHGYLEVKLSLIGFIPDDSSIERAAAHGCSVLDFDPLSAAAKAFNRLADVVGSWATPGPMLADPQLSTPVAVGAI